MIQTVGTTKSRRFAEDTPLRSASASSMNFVTVTCTVHLIIYPSISSPPSGRLNGIFSYFMCRAIAPDELQQWNDFPVVHATRNSEWAGVGSIQWDPFVALVPIHHSSLNKLIDAPVFSSALDEILQCKIPPRGITGHGTNEPINHAKAAICDQKDIHPMRLKTLWELCFGQESTVMPCALEQKKSS